MATDLILNVAGCALCVTYYLAVHKMRAFTAHAYPAASRLLCRCCIARAANFDDDDDIEHWLPVDSEWTVCKQAETSEIFYLTKSQLRSFRQVSLSCEPKPRGASYCFLLKLNECDLHIP